jgi:ABC-2 type transport system ATP-binding protein
LEKALHFDRVSKTFRSSIAGRHLYTLGPVSFEVARGEIFGYLGPNGAGKTTSIKLAMGLLRPSGGRITCFGLPSSSLEARARMGFLPEHPYFYQHLTAIELLELYGDMNGMDRRRARSRAEELLQATGLLEHRLTRISKFSKGMLQRIGLAQALINDPDLVVLDEPLSGLDPVWRRELRVLIRQLKAEGKTVFFSSHILQDVEMICDRVAILSDGQILDVASVADMLSASVSRVEIAVEGLSGHVLAGLGLGCVEARGSCQVLTLAQRVEVNEAITGIVSSGGKVSEVTPLRQTLEDYFMNRIAGMARPSHRRRASDRQPQAETAEGAAIEDNRISQKHV